MVGICLLGKGKKRGENWGCILEPRNSKRLGQLKFHAHAFDLMEFQMWKQHTRINFWVHVLYSQLKGQFCKLGLMLSCLPNRGWSSQQILPKTWALAFRGCWRKSVYQEIIYKKFYNFFFFFYNRQRWTLKLKIKNK